MSKSDYQFTKSLGTKCKFCQTPMVIKISTDYFDLGDPFNLIKLAACNDCADCRSKLIRLKDQIFKSCDGISLFRHNSDTVAKHTRTLRAVVPAYARAFAQVIRSKTVEVPSDFVDCLVSAADRCGKVMALYEKDARRTADAERTML